jgi:hypothetical protein
VASVGVRQNGVKPISGKVTERGKVIHPRKRFGECADRVRAGAWVPVTNNPVSQDLGNRFQLGWGGAIDFSHYARGDFSAFFATPTATTSLSRS